MRKIALPATTTLAAMLALVLHAAPAPAQTRTWVSGTGSDSGPCIRAHPCQTFSFALSQTPAGGIINCVDAGEFGRVVISKSITIDCTGTSARILVPPGGAGIQVNAGASAIVTLRGLSIDGGGTANHGIIVDTGATMHIENCQISGFRGSAPAGIAYLPISGLGELHVSDTIITDSGNPNVGNGALEIIAEGTASINASIVRVQVKNNIYGIVVAGGLGTGVAVNVNVRESVVTGNARDGISVSATPGHPAAVTVLVDRTTSSFNGGSGVLANSTAASGPGSVTVRIGNSVITQNVTGVTAANSGVIRTYKVNEINDNLSDGTPIVNQDALN